MKDPSQHIRTLLTFSAASLAAIVPAAARDGTSTVSYVCVEERTTGWLGDIVGEFKPSADKLIVTWHPGVKSPDGGYELPFIEVAQRGYRRSWQMSACDKIGRIVFRFGTLFPSSSEDCE